VCAVERDSRNNRCYIITIESGNGASPHITAGRSRATQGHDELTGRKRRYRFQDNGNLAGETGATENTDPGRLVGEAVSETRHVHGLLQAETTSGGCYNSIALL